MRKARITWVIAGAAAMLVACGTTGGSTSSPVQSTPPSTAGGSAPQPTGSSPSSASDASGALTIYTGRDEGEVKDVIARFEKKYPETKVSYVILGAQDALDRLRAEKGNPQAGFLWGGTPQGLDQAANEGLLTAYTPSTIDAESFPKTSRDVDKRWWAEMLLPEVIIYNTDLVKPADAPKDWSDLGDPKWKGKIVIRDVMASGTMRSIYSSIVYNPWKKDGKPDAGYDLLRKIDANTVNYAANPNDMYLKMDRGVGSITLWNLQDFFIQTVTNNRPWGYVMPASGAPVLTDGVGIVAGSKQAAAAKKFEDFVLDPETQSYLVGKYYQIPAGKISGDKPKWLADLNLKTQDIDWSVVAQHEKEWMGYWQSNIKGKG